MLVGSLPKKKKELNIIEKKTTEIIINEHPTSMLSLLSLCYKGANFKTFPWLVYWLIILQTWNFTNVAKTCLL